ncbi:MAG: ComEC/Rec2 family competence protein, partial [Helicobacteraceae bacterium]|nr:ComEC/Rec2 family competence protein [Helicobacteraceae bacterium]
MQKHKLFERRSEWAIFFAFCLVVFCVNAAIAYTHYLNLTERKFYDLEARVIAQYQKTSKHDKLYWVLRLNNPEMGNFYTSTYEDLISIIGRDVRLTLITDKIGLYQFLRGFYAPSFRISLLPTDDRGAKLYEKAVLFIADQHEHNYMKELFSALFLAAPQSAELRNGVVKYAAAHLIALSGFHLSILAALLAFTVGSIYKILQSRFFPWRNAFFDLFAISLLLLGFYLVFTGVVPSLLRAYVMFVFGVFLIARHIEIINFQTLLICVFIIISLYPSIILNIGFILSVFGVFYIFLYLHHFRNRPKIESAIGLSVYVFAAMLPIVHYYFPVTAHTQLISPLLTLLYTPFFIFELIVHLIGFGSLLDRFLIYAFEVRVPEWNFSVPLWLCLSYIALSIAAIFHRYIHYVFIATLIVWLFWQYLLVP